MSETVGQIYALIPTIMKKIGAIGKDRRNTTQGYQFRGIDDVYNALAGPMADAGVFFVPEVMETFRVEAGKTAKGATMWSVTIKAAFTFFAPDGSNVRAVTAGEGMDMGDKATNKAMSAALKYALLDVFCIPTEEPRDSENDSPEVQIAKPRADKKLCEPDTMNAAQIKAATEAIKKAFVARGVADHVSVVNRLLEAKQVPGIGEAGRAWCHQLIRDINAGKYDVTQQPETQRKAG